MNCEPASAFTSPVDNRTPDRIWRAARLMLPASIAARLLPERCSTDTNYPDERGPFLDEIRAAANTTRTQHRWGRVRRLFRQEAGEIDDPPLGPQTDLSSQQAITLALQVGAGLRPDELSDVLACSPDEVACNLYAARQRLNPNQQPCHAASRGLITQSTGTDADTESWHALQSHLRNCEKCHGVVRAFDELDEQLVRWLNAQPIPEDTVLQSGHSAKGSLMKFTLAIASFAAIAIVVAGIVVGADRVLGSSRDPIPFFPQVDSPFPDGWLVSSTIDGLGAVNLATGEYRSLVEVTLESGRPPVIVLSPDGDRVALWTFEDGSRIASTIKIVSLDGEVLDIWRWDRTSSPGQLSGWLNNDQLLFVRAPAQGADEPIEDFIDRQKSENQVIVVDISSREQRTLFTGSVAAVVPSPDEHMIAMLGVYDRHGSDSPGRHLEIRPIDGDGLGEPLLTTEGEFPLEYTRPAWSANSRSLYYPAIVASSSTSQEQRETVAINRWTMDRGVEEVARGAIGARIRMLGAAPDGSSVIYLESRVGESTLNWDLKRAVPGDGSESVLASSIAYPFFFSSTVTWLDDGQTAIVSDSRTHFFHRDDPDRGIRAGSTRYLLIDDQDDVHVLRTELGLWGVDAWGVTTLRWFPDDGLIPDRDQQAPEIAGDFGQPVPVEERGGRRHTSEFSQVSQDGEYALFEYSSTGTPLVWRSGRESGRLLGGVSAPGSLSWGNGHPSLIGVHGNEDGRSRLSLHAARSSRVADFFDNRSGDPAGIANSRNLRYDQPRFSPDGNMLSFFVVDVQADSYSLWVSSDPSGNHELMSWQLPDDALVDQPLIAIWSSRSTLVVAAPSSWRDGYPTGVDLIQIDVEPERIDSFSRVDLTTFAPSGDARGITLEAMLPSPDRRLVTFRLREYPSRNPESRVRDQIVVADSSDLNQSIAIARGRAGDGLAWSPDSDWLAYPLDGSLVVSRWDGSERQSILPANRGARFPLWLDGTIYVTSGQESSPELLQILTR